MTTLARCGRVRRRPNVTHTGREGTKVALFQAILILWSILIIGPLLWVLLQSFKGRVSVLTSPFALPRVWHFENYVTAWNSDGLGQSFANTLFVVGFALAFVMLFGSMCAYVIAQYQFFGHRIVYYLMLAGLTFPIFLAIVPLFFTLQAIGLLGTLAGLTVTYVAYALPFTVFFLYGFFRSLPREVAESAVMDGADKWRTFFLVMLPMAKRGLATVAIMNFLGLWNQYLLPVALNADPSRFVLSQAIANFASTSDYNVNYGALFAGVVIVILPVFIVYIVFQRELQGSVSQGTMK